MLINTQFFGDIDIPTEKTITFSHGLMGFENQKQFAIIKNTDTEEPVPFFWLQSVDDPELTFVVTVPFVFKPDYEFDLPDEIAKQLHITETSELGIYSIVSIPKEVSNFSYILMSPIVVNYTTREAQQVVLYDAPFAINATYPE